MLIFSFFDDGYNLPIVIRFDGVRIPFHRILALLSGFCFQVDPHAAIFLTRRILQEGFLYKRRLLI